MTRNIGETYDWIDRVRRPGLIGGLILLLVCVAIGYFTSMQQLLRSYLFSYFFWLGASLGSLAILMLYHLTGGAWGAVIRRMLEAAVSVLPIMAVLFIPIAVGIHSIYPWADAAALHSNHELQAKAGYLNPPFFIVRALIYFAVWLWLAFSLTRLSRRQDEETDPAILQRMQARGSVGLLIYVLSVTFASFDWLMSLEPAWFSTIFGLLIVCGQVLNAYALAIVFTALLLDYRPYSDVVGPTQFHDLGKFMLTFVMLWAYMSFSQFLIIWAGNLPEETPWYVHRLSGGWQIVALLLIVLHFALPFMLLLSRRLKRNPRRLIYVALLVLVMRFVDLFWLTAPDFEKGIHVHVLDVLLPLAIGGVWTGFFLRSLRSRPLMPLHDHNLPVQGVALQEALRNG